MKYSKRRSSPPRRVVNGTLSAATYRQIIDRALEPTKHGAVTHINPDTIDIEAIRYTKRELAHLQTRTRA